MILMKSLTVDSLKDCFTTKNLNNYPSLADYKRIVQLLFKQNYLQIYYEYGVTYLLILINYFEQNDEYEICGKIKKCIEDINKVTGYQNKTKL